MLVWGGLHQRGPTAELELLDIPSRVWRKGCHSPGWFDLLLLTPVSPPVDSCPGDAAGQEPSPRFGHSCVSVPCVPWPGDTFGTSVGRLIFTGGSDGSDLVRNGRELREVRCASGSPSGCYMSHRSRSRRFICVQIHVLHIARASAANRSGAYSSVRPGSPVFLLILYACSMCCPSRHAGLVDSEDGRGCALTARLRGGARAVSLVS